MTDPITMGFLKAEARLFVSDTKDDHGRDLVARLLAALEEGRGRALAAEAFLSKLVKIADAADSDIASMDDWHWETMEEIRRHLDGEPTAAKAKGPTRDDVCLHGKLLQRASCLSFLRSVILSGEGWSDQCERMYAEAMCDPREQEPKG